VTLDHDQAAALPHSYAVALRLHDGGAKTTTIACALGISPTEVPTVLELARAKLAELERSHPTTTVVNRKDTK
jgi:hypothetical protein